MPSIERDHVPIDDLLAAQEALAARAWISSQAVSFASDPRLAGVISRVLASDDARAIVTLRDKLLAIGKAADARRAVDALQIDASLLVPKPTDDGSATKDSATAIPPEHRSRELTKAEAARLHSGSRVKNPSDYFRKRPDVRIEGSGRRWFVDCTQFPPSAQEKLRG
ncbi:MAG: hypothetical protein AAGI53_17600 [Planctomycetota bacterium]